MLAKRLGLRLALLLAAAALGQAYDFAALKPQGYVSDFARAVDTASKVELERYCRELEDRTGVQLAFVTIPSLENEPIEDVANLLYRTWGVGQKKSNEGALLLLAINDRKSRLEIGYGLEPIVPDVSTARILRAMRPALREGHYGDAMIAAAKAMGDDILAAKGASQPPAPMRPARQRSPEAAVPTAVWTFLAIIVLMFLLNSRRSAARHGYQRAGGFWPIFLPPGIPGNFPRHGGGFGGLGGSGGFGGFGGGDSGGGGSSDSW